MQQNGLFQYNFRHTTYLVCSRLRIVFFLVLFSTTSRIHAQDASFSFGYATYNGGKLNALQTELFDKYAQLPVLVDDFPGNFYGDFSFNFWDSGKFKSGVFLSTFSTGSRQSYSDNTGKILIDMHLNGVSWGVAQYFMSRPNTNSILIINTRQGIDQISFGYSELYMISNQTRKNTDTTLKGANFFLEFIFRYQYSFTQQLYLDAHLGYHITAINRDLNSNQTFDIETAPLTVSLDGLRTGIGLVYFLKKEE